MMIVHCIVHQEVLCARLDNPGMNDGHNTFCSAPSVSHAAVRNVCWTPTLGLHQNKKCFFEFRDMSVFRSNKQAEGSSDTLECHFYQLYSCHLLFEHHVGTLKWNKYGISRQKPNCHQSHWTNQSVPNETESFQNQLKHWLSAAFFSFSVKASWLSPPQ